LRRRDKAPAARQQDAGERQLPAYRRADPILQLIELGDHLTFGWQLPVVFEPVTFG
jgi:hypothetical protein